MVLFSQTLSFDRSILHHPSNIFRPTKSQKLYTDSSFGYDVLNYDIKIDVDFPGKNISYALTTITAVATQSRSVIKLNFSGMTIDTVKFDGTVVSYNRTGSGMDQLLEINASISIGDTFTISVFYNGTPDEGIYYSSNNGGLTYVMSIPWETVSNFPVGPRYWFPCNDMLNDKATSTMHITVPQNYEVVANGSLERIDTLAAEWTYKWVEKYPIPTWYMVFSISEYAIVRDSFLYEDTVTPISHFVFHSESANAVVTFQDIKQILKFFSDTFGYKYPYYDEKYGFVRVPKPSLGYWLMEYPTNVFYALTTPGNHNYEIIFAHETSHQWWGGSVTPKSTKDIWLNEGVATYCEALYSDFWTGDTLDYHSYMKAGIMDYYLPRENYPLGHPFPIYDPIDSCIWSATTYEKAGSVLHMLRHIIGDTTFFNVLRTYYATYKHSNANTMDFWNIAESVSGMSLNWFYNEWIYKAGHPAYQYAWQYDSVAADNFNLYLTIIQTQSHNWDVPTFKMPIDVEIYKSSGDTEKVVVWDSLDAQGFTIPLDSKPLDIAFDPGNWILKTKQLIAVEENIPSFTFKCPRLSVAQNPLRKGTVISYDLPVRVEHLLIAIFDITGRCVKPLVNSPKPSGNYNLNLDVGGLSSGIYFITLSADNYKTTKKLALLK